MQSPNAWSQYTSPLREQMQQYTASLSGGDAAAVLGPSFDAQTGLPRMLPHVTPSMVQNVTDGMCRAAQLDAGPVPEYTYSDLLLPAQSFAQQMTSGWTNGNPELAALFLAPKNVQRVLEQARGHLSDALQKAVHIPVDAQVIETFVDLMQSNAGAIPNAIMAQQLSETAMNRLLSERFYGLRQRELYQRYFIDKDRIRTMPYGDYQGHKRGEILLDTSGTMLANPAKRYQAQYLRDTMLPLRTQQLDTNMCQPRAGYF